MNNKLKLLISIKAGIRLGLLADRCNTLLSFPLEVYEVKLTLVTYL